MNGSLIRRIRRLPRFQRDIENLTKSHYRKNKKDRTSFLELVAKIIESLAVDPFPSRSRDEPWPHGSAVGGWQFRKLEFPMPGLRGASGQGRLMYLASQEEVVPFWLYTHEEFSGRPSDSELMLWLRHVLEEPPPAATEDS